MSQITMHSKQRIVERADNVNNFTEAKKMAKQAWISGKTINYFQKYPEFFNYLVKRRDQTRSCSIRVYKDNIYVWRGRRHILLTVLQIPEKYKEEMRK